MSARVREVLRILTAVSLFASSSISLAQVQPNPPTQVTVEGGTVVPGGEIFADDFEYSVDRDVDYNSVTPFTAHGWAHAKSANLGNYTRNWAILYTIPSPSPRTGRSLLMEANAAGGGQTDFFLQYGSESSPIGYIPANVWFTFWTYAMPGSQFSGSDKFMYPTRTSYPVPGGSEQHSWMILTGGTNDMGAGPSVGSVGGRYINNRPVGALNMAMADSNDRNKLHQNVNATPMNVATWYQVKMQMDTSGEQGVWRVWRRQHGVSAWTLIADWRGGVTPQFTWPLTSELRQGHRAMRMPTTVNNADNKVLIDEFRIYTSDPG